MGWLFKPDTRRKSLLAERIEGWQRTTPDGMTVTSTCLAHCYRGGSFSGVLWTVWERTFEKDGVLYASGFCGSGVVWAPWVGMRAAHKLMGHAEQARSAFDFRPPAAVPLYRGNAWFMPAIIKGYAVQDQIAWWKTRR